jgi:hypothetical protein
MKSQSTPRTSSQPNGFGRRITFDDCCTPQSSFAETTLDLSDRADLRKARFCSFEERQKRGDARRRTGSAYAPAAGRLAAAMATISARRRPIRDPVERSNELKWRISNIPAASAEAFGQNRTCKQRMGIHRAGVEPAAKIATPPPSVPTWQQIHCGDAPGDEENLLRPTSGKPATQSDHYPGLKPKLRSKRLT